MKSFFTTKRICRAAVIAALYAALTMALAPISYGPFQCRISEALTVLPLFFPEAIVGLTLGCLISNIIGNGILDIIFGTLATLLAAITTYFIGKMVRNKTGKLILGELPPIIYNAIIVPFTFLAIAELKEAYFINLLWVGLGQLAAIGVGGTIIYFAVLKLKNTNFFKDAENAQPDQRQTLLNLAITFGIVIPCVGAIIATALSAWTVFFVLLGVGILLIAVSVALKIVVSRKTKTEA